MDLEPHQARILHQPALDDARQQGDINIAATDEGHRLLMLELCFAVQEDRHGSGASTFSEHLFAFQESENSAGYFFLFH